MYRKLLTLFAFAGFFWGLFGAANLPLANASMQAKGEWVFPPYTKEGGLPSNYVYSIKINSAGEIWCCSAEGAEQNPTGGISRYIGSLEKREYPEWVTYDTSNGLPDKRVYSFDFDAANYIWVGTQKGVCKIDPSGSLIYCPKELENYPIRFVEVSPTGEVWLAKTASPGNGPALYRFDGAKWTRYDSTTAPYPNGLLDYDINTIAISPQAEVWIGTASGGVSKLNPAQGTWTHYTPANSGLPSATVNTISFDGFGNAWFGVTLTSGGTEEAAKLNLSTNAWTRYGVGNSAVVSIAPLSANEIWFGTLAEGAYLYDPSRPANSQWILFSTTSTEEGLPNDDVTGIVHDNSGYLWLATLSGGIGRLLAKSIPEFTESGTEIVPGQGSDVTSPAGGGTGEAGSGEKSKEQQEAEDAIKRLAHTGLNLLPYLIPGLFLLLLGLGSNSR